MMKWFSAFIIGLFAIGPKPVITPSSVQQYNPVIEVTTSPPSPTSTGKANDVFSLPLGDGKYSTSGPKKGYIYLCRVMNGGGGAEGKAPWITGSTWNLNAKPSVIGHITWSNAVFTSTVVGANRVLAGNDLPLKATTGIFPVQSTDPAYAYDKNPNTIAAHSFTLTLPQNPTATSSPHCIQGEVGIMLNGVPLFNGFDAENRDAAAHEVQDSCDGHPQEAGEYHYHSLSRCIQDIHENTIIGYALDGFPITGPVLSNGNYLTTNDLDECHGTTSEIMIDGQKKTTYHYVMTQDFPYSVSCFKGKPVQMQVISNMGRQTTTTNSKPSGQLPQRSNRQPPQEAFTSCSGKSTGASCSFTTPNGTISGNCQIPPEQSLLICVPGNRAQQ